MLSKPREDYLRPPSPYASFETFPWRFNRTMSYLRRPLLLRERDGIEEVVWGPRHVFDAAQYLIHLCQEGRLPRAHTQTNRMRQVMGEIHTRQGEDFNNRVADECEQKGWLVRRRVKRIRKLRIPEGISGDFDVLAVDIVRRRILVLECKNLAHARTPYEMANEAENLIQAREGKRAAVDQVREQTQWLQENLPAVLEWVGADALGKWKIEPKVITDHVMTAPYLQDSPVPILSLSQFMVQLKGTGHRLSNNDYGL